MTTRPAPDRILDVAFAFWGSRTLLAATEMGLFTELARKPASLHELRVRLGLHVRSAHDFLDALVALGFLRREGDVYHNTEETGLFLDREKPSYIGGMLEMAGARLYGFWDALPEALRTGELQNEAKGGGPNFFSAIYSDPERLKAFLRAMSGLSRAANIRIAELLPWKQYKTFVDVGTAQGDLAVQVALRQPHLRGIGFDLPEVASSFVEYVRGAGLTERVHFEGGSFFEDPIPRADVVLMGHILHDWSLDEKHELIRKAYEALPEGGCFASYDAIIDDDRSKNAFGLLMSLNMLIETEAGFDYTGADCRRWMQEAGFRETRVEHLAGPDSMVVGIK